MAHPAFVKLGVLFILMHCAISIGVVAVEYYYYHQCKSSLYKILVYRISPLCKSITSVSDFLQSASQHFSIFLFEAAFIPLLHIIKKYTNQSLSLRKLLHDTSPRRPSRECDTYDSD